MKPRAIEWTGAPQMDTGAPMPQIKLLEGRELLCGYIVSKRTISNVSNEEFAVVAFHGVSQFTFGYPNDEALGAHPLYDHGISFYAFNQLEDSPYLKELGRRNASVFPGSESFWTSKQHYIVSFHDETLEVVCSGVDFLGSVGADSASDAINKLEAEQVSGGNGGQAR